MNMLIDCGKAIKLDVETGRIPADVMNHVVKIGLRNILMDCHAGITKKENPGNYQTLAREKVEAKLAAMYAGDIRVARATSGVTRDPVRAEALSMARKIVAGVFYFKPKDKTWAIRDQEQFAEIKSALGDEYSFDQDGLREVWDYLVDAQADECMDAAEVAVEARASVKRPISLAGLVKA